ncbi:MAG: hypothetical protein KA481_00055 [Flavobacterium sp.]|nr:hypothetical protein [Flavobacterium sp.]
MKKLHLFYGLILAAVLFSCSKDEAIDQNISASDVTIDSKIDIASDDISDIVGSQEMATYSNSISGRETGATSTTLTNCATVTRVPAFGTPLTPGTQVTKTIDFGTVNCTLENGNTVRGKIIISFVFQPTATSHTITYTFDNFYHNDIKYVGTKTFTRSMVTTANGAVHPIVTMTMDMTVTFPNGDVFTRVGTRTREIIEGYTTAPWADNIYQITGNWTTTRPNGSTRTATITTPLRIRMSCVLQQKPVTVKGIIAFVSATNTASIDYGNGDCDTTAVLTINGVSSTITIGN